jgi:endonuclease/exonuclease/phosphatase family metal-dependent hydrolase
VRWAPSPDGEFTLLSYNIRCDIDGEPHTWREREGHVEAVLRQHKPSVVCLQESTPATAAALARGGGLRVLGAVRCRTGRPEGAHILYDAKRWRCVTSSTRVLTEGGPARCGARWCTQKTVFGGETAKHPRLFTHAQLKQRGAGGETLHVLNTHFPLSEKLQRASAAQLAGFAKGLKGRVVLCGDLNSHYSPAADGTPLQTLLRDGGLSDALGLRDSSTFGPYGSVSATTHRLDYVLYRGMQPPVKSGVSDYRYGPERFRPSDHSAVHATFAT